MQDTRNLLKKRDIEIPKAIRKAVEVWDVDTANYYRRELTTVTRRLEERRKNKAKNEKLFKKKH